MVNNIGKTSTVLDTKLGNTIEFSEITTITILTGSISTGCLLFDEVGTLGVVTNYTSDTDFVVTTYALSIDIQQLLDLSY